MSSWLPIRWVAFAGAKQITASPTRSKVRFIVIDRLS